MYNNYKITTDTHVHTVMSGHAHSTVLEYLSEAKKKGFNYLCITDHTGILNSATDPLAYFLCLNSTLPEEYDGIKIVKGCEVNIISENGDLDLEERVLNTLRIVIASLHRYLIPPESSEKTTEIWLKIAENPCVNVIGHFAEPCWDCDYEKVIGKFKECGKVVEINAGSIRKGEDYAKNWEKAVSACKEFEMPVVVSSDCHFAPFLGRVDESFDLLSRVNYPKELILNIRGNEEKFENKFIK